MPVRVVFQRLFHRISYVYFVHLRIRSNILLDYFPGPFFHSYQMLQHRLFVRLQLLAEIENQAFVFLLESAQIFSESL